MKLYYCIPLTASECSEPKAAIFMVIPSKHSTLVGRGTTVSAPAFHERHYICSKTICYFFYLFFFIGTWTTTTTKSFKFWKVTYKMTTYIPKKSFHRWLTFVTYFSQVQAAHLCFFPTCIVLHPLSIKKEKKVYSVSEK